MRRGVSLTNEGQSFLGQAVRLGPGRALTGSRNCLSRRSKSGQNDSSFPRLQLRPSWRVRNLCLFLFTPLLTESEASESGLLAYQKIFLPIQKPIWLFQKHVGQGRLTARGGACAVVHHYMRMFSLMPQEKGKKKSFLDCPRSPAFPKWHPPNPFRALLWGYITPPASGEVTHGTETLRKCDPCAHSVPMATPAAVLGGPGIAVRVGFLPELGLRAGGGEEGSSNL